MAIEAHDLLCSYAPHFLRRSSPVSWDRDAGAFSLQYNKIITTGEGGVMITDRSDVYELAVDVHDCATD